MKTAEDVMEILEAYDLACSLRDSLVVTPSQQHRATQEWVSTRDLGFGVEERARAARDGG